jgi:hypothetical protein
MAKGCVPIRPGHHGTGNHQMWSRVGEVHHFKWTQSMIEEQERRARSYRDQGLCYHSESERLLSYLTAKQKKIPMHDPALNVRVVAPDPLQEI